MFLVIVRLLTDTSFTISIATLCELYWTIILSAGKTLFNTVLIKAVPSRTETAKSFTTSTTTRTRVYPMRACSTMVPMTSTIRLGNLCSCGLLQTEMKPIQLGSKTSLRSRFGPPPESKTKFTRRIHDQSSSIIMASFHGFIYKPAHTARQQPDRPRVQTRSERYRRPDDYLTGCEQRYNSSEDPERPRKGTTTI